MACDQREVLVLGAVSEPCENSCGELSVAVVARGEFVSPEQMDLTSEKDVGMRATVDACKENCGVLVFVTREQVTAKRRVVGSR